MMNEQNQNQNKPRIAFDLGGVIIHREALENFLIDESDLSVRLTVQKFKPQNVFIISKAKQKFIQRNIDLLVKVKFFQATGLKQQNVYFVNQYQDKAILMKKLNITYIVDDSVKIYKDCIKNGLKPILFGDHEDLLKHEPGYVSVKGWKGFRKYLQKIPE